jgi:hypothetical protein
MLLALLALAIVAAVLALPTIASVWSGWRERRAKGRSAGRRRERLDLHDPGRERRAEQRARELLRSCVNAEEWAMYRDLGFIRVHGRLGQVDPATGEPAYAYLVYPHKPIVAYVPKTRRLLSEYCVEFPDLTRAISQSRLPDSDDVLAKWMALTGDEEHLIRNANMHLPGRQIDPGRVRRDLWRLAEWERQSHGFDSCGTPNT